MSRVKVSKLVKELINIYLDMNAAIDIKVEVCQDNIAWAEQENRCFLRQLLETRLIALYYDNGQYVDSLNLISPLLTQLKKLNVKSLLMEVQLLESKVYYSLSNIPKARAALISARSMGNSIYLPPTIQGDLDLQAGLIHAADKDLKISYSYFMEAFDQYDSVDDPKAIKALKYMLLFKVLLKQTDDIDKILSGKNYLKYSGKDIDAMKAISVASKNRSIKQFQLAINEYPSQLKEDNNIQQQLDILYDGLVEGNLCKIIEPYSTIQIDYVASKIGLLREDVEKKLSQMILDKKICGILDQCSHGNALILFNKKSLDKTFDDVIQLIAAMNGVVDRLYQAAKNIN